MNFRDPPLIVQGVKLTLQPSFPGDFYFAGQSPPFFLNWENPTPTNVTIVGQVIWELRTRYGNYRESELVTLNCLPSQHGSHGLAHRWLPSPGEAVYVLALTAIAIPGQTVPPTQLLEGLASYTVLDRRVKQEEDEFRKKEEVHKVTLETLQERTFYAFLASMVASAVLAVVGLYLAFRWPWP